MVEREGDTSRMASIRELGPQETRLAYPALLELRPHLVSLEALVQQVNEAQRSEGYRLIGSFEDGMEDAAAVAGFRTAHGLAWGYYLYIDDLSTRAAFRQRGHGACLMQWLIEEARRLGCGQVHLDSGVQRHDAHRLYLNQRMDITAYHFYRGL
jgi:GNAT superfamily N-acetyltransferase